MVAFKLTPFWGTLPDWLAALGTVGAFFAGLRLLRKELDARREHEEDRRRAQARLVVAWTDIEQGGPEAPQTANFVFTMRNGSDEPIYDVKITMVAAASPFAHDPEAVWNTDGTPREAGPLKFAFSMVPPGDETKQTIFWQVVPSPYPPLALSFTDAQERRWKRYPNGRLEGSPPESRRSVKDRLDSFAKGQVDELDS